MKYKYLLLTLSLFLFCFSESAIAAESEIYVINFSGAISPGSADFLKSGIKKASDDNVACIIIVLDTPGGLAESMRDIVKTIFASQVPVVIYVAPGGARAASAGVMITMAADIAAMAPGTNIGAAHPVGAGGKEINKTMSEKVTNDMVAHAKSIARKRGRNAQWVERAVRKSVSVTETEALKENIIDIVAKDLDDLIRKVQDKGVLDLDDVKTTILKETIRNKILKTISDPNIAYILLMIGLAGLYFELSHPGVVLPGVIGGIALILAFFMMEMKISSYGLLSIAGIISLLLGSLMLFDRSNPEMQLSLGVLIPTIVLVSGFFVTVAALVFKSQLSKPLTGANGLVGEIGIVKKDLMPAGKVFVHGELWNATAKDTIQEGTRVRVVDVVNLVLEVEPAE